MNYYDDNRNIERGIFLGGTLDGTIDNASLSAGQIFSDHDLGFPGATPSWIDIGLSNDTHWPMEHQSSVSAGVASSVGTLGANGFYVGHDQSEEFVDYQFTENSGVGAIHMTETAEPFPGYLYNTVPTGVIASPFPSTPGNGYAIDQSDQGDALVYRSSLTLGYDHGAGGGDSLDHELSSHSAQTPSSSGSGASLMTPPQANLSPAVVLSSPFQCSSCPSKPKFGTFNECKRHQNTTKSHRTEGSKCYQCACGKVDGRRDNYRRHIKSCNAPGTQLFVCRCGEESFVQVEHVAHVKHCVQRRPYYP